MYVYMCVCICVCMSIGGKVTSSLVWWYDLIHTIQRTLNSWQITGDAPVLISVLVLPLVYQWLAKSIIINYIGISSIGRTF